MDVGRDRFGPFPHSAHHYEYDDANDNTRRALRPQQPELRALAAHNILCNGSYSPWLYEFPFLYNLMPAFHHSASISVGGSFFCPHASSRRIIMCSVHQALSHSG